MTEPFTGPRDWDDEPEDPRIGILEDARNAPVSEAEADRRDKAIWHYPEGFRD
jgi:hypothetical protein